MDREKGFREVLSSLYDKLSSLKGSNIIVGIPFLGTPDEMRTLRRVVEITREGFERFFPEVEFSFIFAGSEGGNRFLPGIEGIIAKGGIRGICYTLKRGIDGKGWAFRSFLEIARLLDADLILMPSNLLRRKKKGLQPEWIYSLYRPLQLGYEFVLPVFNRPPEGRRLTDHFISPLIISLYGYRLKEPIGGIYGIGKGALKHFLGEEELFSETDVGSYGIDIFLTLKAIVEGLSICQANLGTKFQLPPAGSFAVRLRQILNTMIYLIGRTSAWWIRWGRVMRAEPPFFGNLLQEPLPSYITLDLPFEIKRFKMDLERYKEYLYKRLFPPSLYERLLDLSLKNGKTFHFSPADWAECVYILILAYFFQKEIPKQDILESLLILYRARLATFFKEVRELDDEIRRLEAERLREVQIAEFAKRRDPFEKHWREGKLIYKAPVERVLLEFLPDVPLNLPREVQDQRGNRVRVSEIYEEVIAHIDEKAEEFLPPYQPVTFLEKTLTEVNEALKERLGGDIYSVGGVRALVEKIFDELPDARKEGFFLDRGRIERFLEGNVPYSLLELIGQKDLEGALKRNDPADLLIMSFFTEGTDFHERFWDWFRNARADWFTPSPKGFLIRERKNFPQWVQSRGEPSEAELLCGKILITPYPRAAEIEFPYLLYLSLIAKLNVELEIFSEDWRKFSQEGRFAEKVMNSLRQRWSKDPLSAHEVFEAYVNECSVRRIGASPLLQEVLGKLLELYYVVYRRDGTLLTLGFPSWAIYRTWGRKGVPSKGFLSGKTKVEQRWFVREIISRVTEVMGIGDRDYLYEKIREIRGKGKAAQNLAIELGLFPPISVDRENLPVLFSPPPTPEDVKGLTQRMGALLESLPHQPTVEDFITRLPQSLRPAEEQIEEVRLYAERLRGLEITHVNSTRLGGGVAEILHWLVPLMNSIGIRAKWLVIRPQNPKEFFPVTKAFHNALQGAEIPLSEAMKEIYLSESERLFRELSRRGELRGDVIICHDPQPLATISQFDGKKVWRAHIDLSSPNREFVRFLLPFIEEFDVAIFHFGDFVLEELKGRLPIYLIPAGISFLTPKNVELPQGFCSYVLESLGIDRQKPMVLQISRFDRFKDPRGVVEAFERARTELAREGIEIQLVYAGNMARDDPEGGKILSELIGELGAKKRPMPKRPLIPKSVVWAVGDPPHIFIVNLGATPLTENSLVVNALQRSATIVLQKSLREGLGLTILEAMGKGRPVIVGNVGGPAHLIKEDGMYGYGVGYKDARGNLVYTAEETAGKILQCFEAPVRTMEMARRAQRNVALNYSAIRHLLDYLKLLDDLVNGPSLSPKVSGPNFYPI